MAYVMMADRVEREAQFARLAAVILATAGAKVDPTDPDEARASFDAWLAEPLAAPEPDKRTKERRELEAALGLN